MTLLQAHVFLLLSMPAVFACGARSTLDVAGVEGPRLASGDGATADVDAQQGSPEGGTVDVTGEGPMLDGPDGGSDGATAHVANRGSAEGGTLCAYIKGPVASCDSNSLDDPVQICPAEAPFCTNYLGQDGHYGCCTYVGGACSYDAPGIGNQPNWPRCIFPCCP